MCPDRQLFSIYMDGELPSPWKEKLETHLEECSECREKLNNLLHLRELFTKETSQKRTYVEKTKTGTSAGTPEVLSLSEQDLMEKAKERIWQKLESGYNFRRSRLIRQSRHFYSQNMWKRKVSLPIPAAAAAAIVIALLTAFWVNKGSVNNSGFAYQTADLPEKSGFILAAEEELPGIMPVGDFNSVLQYLGVERSEVIILQLPESRNFSRSGEPAIIRSADYTRR